MIELTLAEKKIYFMALCLVVTADNQMSVEEERYLVEIAVTLEIDQKIQKNILKRAFKDKLTVTELSRISEVVVARTIYKDCLLIANADHIISPEEKFILTSIRMNLGISDTREAEFQSWIDSVIVWQKKGEFLVQKEDRMD